MQELCTFWHRLKASETAKDGISWLVNYMRVYYDLQSDRNVFGEQRWVQDDLLWDNLAFIIPPLCRQIIRTFNEVSLPCVVNLNSNFSFCHVNFYSSALCLPTNQVLFIV